jgi:hypothetical protein
MIQIGDFSKLSRVSVKALRYYGETEARQRVREETERLECIESRLRQIEQENNMSKYDFVIKNMGAVKVASVHILSENCA